MNISQNRPSPIFDEKKIAENDAKEQETRMKTVEFINKLAGKLGFETVNNFDELELTPEQIKKIFYVKPSLDKLSGIKNLYYRKTLENGEIVKLCARPSGLSGDIAAEIFSSKFDYEGHATNHSFSHYSFENLLRISIGLKKQE